MREVLEDNILRFWMDNMVDEEHGGFYGRMDGKGVMHPDADKGAILNARRSSFGVIIALSTSWTIFSFVLLLAYSMRFDS